jgi:hypothetical protein
MDPQSLYRNMQQPSPEQRLVRLVMLNATNPRLAQQALAADPEVQQLLAANRHRLAQQQKYRQPQTGGFPGAATAEFPVAGDTPSSYGGR